MAFQVKVTGASSFEFTKEVVTGVEFGVETPGDSNARSKDLKGTVAITGKILTGLDGAVVDQSIKAAQWSLVTADKADAYRNVTIEIIAAGQVVRQVIVPDAFCVDYKEELDDETGVGTFRMVVRQKKDKLDRLQINGGYAAS